MEFEAEHCKLVCAIKKCGMYAERPQIVEGPEDILVQENANVTFKCQATGHPQPTIIWKKVDGQMPQGRSVQIVSLCETTCLLLLSPFCFIFFSDSNEWPI